MSCTGVNNYFVKLSKINIRVVARNGNCVYTICGYMVVIRPCYARCKEKVLQAIFDRVGAAR